jgi:hypothetical protein
MNLHLAHSLLRKGGTWLYTAATEHMESRRRYRQPTGKISWAVRWLNAKCNQDHITRCDSRHIPTFMTG